MEFINYSIIGYRAVSLEDYGNAIRNGKCSEVMSDAFTSIVAKSPCLYGYDDEVFEKTLCALKEDINLHISHGTFSVTKSMKFVSSGGSDGFSIGAFTQGGKIIFLITRE